MIRLGDECRDCGDKQGTNRQCEHCELVRTVKLLSRVVHEQGDQIRELEKRVTELRRLAWV
jgi:TolA-binding protein